MNGDVEVAEHLTTGWESDLAVGDTLLRRFLFHEAASYSAYAEVGGGATMQTAAYAVADLRRPSGYFNSITLLKPPADDFGTVLDEVDNFMAGGTGDVLLWSAWPTPDLTPRGWRLEGHPPLLVRPPANVLPAPSAPDVDVRRVSTPQELAEWERVAIEGFPLPELDGAGPGGMADPRLLQDERFAFWVGREEDGRDVSIGASFVEHGIGSFALGVTRPDARRKGHWLRHAVVRLNHAPDVWMTGIFSDFSRPGAEAIGFVPILRLTLWSRARR